MYEIIRHYCHDAKLRHSLCGLAKRTFGLELERWYQNGFWSERYDPYSIAVDGKIVANVSVNHMDMQMGDRPVKLLQLGTVMTDPEFRNRGLIRAIMREIMEDYQDKVDGIYLFANDSVLDFYPKFGFRRAEIYGCGKNVSVDAACEMERVPMDAPADWERFGQVMERSRYRGGFDMINNAGLVFFRLTRYMKDCVWYSPKLDVYAIAEMEGDCLILHNVFAERQMDLDAVIHAFGSGAKSVRLGFTPADTVGFDVQQIYEEDTTLFVMGDFFVEFAEKRLGFPTMSYA